MIFWVIFGAFSCFTLTMIMLTTQEDEDIKKDEKLGVKD